MCYVIKIRVGGGGAPEGVAITRHYLSLQSRLGLALL